MRVTFEEFSPTHDFFDYRGNSRGLPWWSLILKAFATDSSALVGLRRHWISREYPQGWNGSRVKRVFCSRKPRLLSRSFPLLISVYSQSSSRLASEPTNVRTSLLMLCATLNDSSIEDASSSPRPQVAVIIAR